MYSASKAALQNITMALAQELAPEVRVNAIAPGAILLPEQAQSEQEASAPSHSLTTTGHARRYCASSMVFDRAGQIHHRPDLGR